MVYVEYAPKWNEEAGETASADGDVDVGLVHMSVMKGVGDGDGDDRFVVEACGAGVGRDVAS